MIQITPHMKILLAVEPVDFRKGIDEMATLCQWSLKIEPFMVTKIEPHQFIL